MNKYTELSDFEINKKVADLIGAKPYPFGSTEYHRSAVCGMENAIIIKSPRKVGSFDPCNNPADAMPIIIENGISMVRVNNTWSARQFNNHCIEINGDNYYRIAMEVYLLMNGK